MSSIKETYEKLQRGKKGPTDKEILEAADFYRKLADLMMECPYFTMLAGVARHQQHTYESYAYARGLAPLAKAS